MGKTQHHQDSTEGTAHPHAHANGSEVTIGPSSLRRERRPPIAGVRERGCDATASSATCTRPAPLASRCHYTAPRDQPGRDHTSCTSCSTCTATCTATWRADGSTQHLPPPPDSHLAHCHRQDRLARIGPPPRRSRDRHRHRRHQSRPSLLRASSASAISPPPPRPRPLTGSAATCSTGRTRPDEHHRAPDAW